MTTDTPRKKYKAPNYFCAACRKRGKDWNGDDPTCAFQHGRPFSVDNWSCATMDLVRDLIGHYGSPEKPGIRREHVEDQTYATVRLDTDSAILQGIYAFSLYVTWYKNRGRTGGMWLMSDEDAPPRPPTEAETLAILAYYAPEAVQARRDWWHRAGHDPKHCPY